MAKIKIIHEENGLITAIFNCPACNDIHAFKYYSDPFKYTNTDKDPWKFNYNFDRPIIRPSISVDAGNSNINYKCHSYVEEGFIKYLDDCSHAMKGLSIELPDII